MSDQLQEQLQLANARVSAVHRAHIDEVNAHLETKAQGLLVSANQANQLVALSEEVQQKQAAIDVLQKTVNSLTEQLKELQGEQPALHLA